MLEEYQGFDDLESSIVQAVDTEADGDQSLSQGDDENEEGEGTEEGEFGSKTEGRLETEGDSSLGVETDLRSVLDSEKDLGEAVGAGHGNDDQQVEQLGPGGEGISVVVVSI